MKKIILFLIIFLGMFFLNIKETHAASFYQAEKIPNIYMNKYNPQDNLIYYHPAQIIRESSTNKIAYCLEPFTELNNNSDYTESYEPDKYNKPQYETIPLITYFGYGYEGHTDPKWYAITQMLIWKTVYPITNYYYTATPNGEKISFWDEENEIYELIEAYKKNTSFNNKEYTIVTEKRFTEHDYNNVISTYKPTNPNITIAGNNIETPTLTTGTYEIILEKQTPTYNEQILFYISNNNQDVITIGKPKTKINKIKINVVETEININKIDNETGLSTPQGEASLKEAILSLYNDKNIFIQDIILNEQGKAKIKNLNFGSYYIKEKKPGTGYILNNEKYYFRLDSNNTKININIKNQVIKGKLVIKKEYGTKDNFKPEANISFNIYNNQNQLIDTIITNEQGTAEIILPYGKYHLVQLTTTEGYQKIEPIEIEIKQENETLIKELKNYKIDVPNTRATSFLEKIINFIKELLC